MAPTDIRAVVKANPIPRDLVHAEMDRLEAAEGVELFNEVAAYIRRYVVLNDAALHTVTAWVVHAHAIEKFYTTPRLNITSPEAECGKTMLLVDVMAPLLPDAVVGVSMSPATLYRLLDNSTPAILLDELDNTLGRKGAADSETLSLLLAILNSGYRRGSYVYRCVGKDHTPTKFPTFAPVAFAGIAANLAHPFLTRAIEIPLAKRTADEALTEMEWSETIADECAALNERISVWVEAHLDEIAQSNPTRPDGMTGRRAEIWTPLLRVADVSGGEWADRIRNAFQVLTVGNQSADSGFAHKLLADLHTVFEEEELHTTTILARLNKIEDSPWSTWNDGAGIKAYELAKYTKKYRTHDKTAQVWADGKNRQGYQRAWFEDAWKRYLVPPPEPETPRTPRTLAAQGIPRGSRVLGGTSLEAPQPLQGNGSRGLGLLSPEKGTRGAIDTFCEVCGEPAHPYLNHVLCDEHKEVLR